MLKNPTSFVQTWKDAVIKDLGNATQVLERLSEMESQKILAGNLEASCHDLRQLKEFVFVCSL